MRKAVVYETATGVIVATGTIRMDEERSVEAGQSVVYVENIFIDMELMKVKDGAIVAMTKPERDKLHYKERRSEEFPEVGDVIDALMKVVTIPHGSDLEAIETSRQAVKMKYPKS